ncbi:MAG: site-specific DNA-methyltransferase [Synergistaceae bacterium]|nr:site-specific DNA-methyltransferase [Synergistaceae bacterium]
MNKPKFETPDLTAANITKLAELFPGVVADGKVNVELLRSYVGEEIFGDEAYEFTWVGKRAAIAEAGRPIRKTLRPCVEESKNWDTTENLYIEGDNLDVLKLLQESYLGKVKMIYIDPPYNTGNDFIYRDKWRVANDEWQEMTGEYDEDGDRLFRNTETNGRFHSDWCSMMYPRLVLARNLLSDDGLIFISIGDEEVNNLRQICDEVFGTANFRNQIVIRRGAKSVQAQFDTWDKLGQGLEYLLLYSRNQIYRFPKQLKTLEEAKTGTWNNHWRGTDRPTMRYSIFGMTPESGQWRWGKDRSEVAIQNYQRLLKDIGETENSVSLEQIDAWYLSQNDNSLDLLRLSKTGKPEHYIAPTSETLLNSSWVDLLIGNSSEIIALFGKIVFDTAKLTQVISRMLRFISNDAIILDFFSGSATAAHAVMQLNAEDGGKRKFIMVQLPEVCAEGTEAAKAGYKNICEIGKERIRRAGEKIVASAESQVARNTEDSSEWSVTSDKKNEKRSFDTHRSSLVTRHSSLNSPLDTGFRVLKLDDTNMKDVYYAATEYTQDLLSIMESNIKDDRNDMDLLFGCLLDWRLPLSMPHTHENIDGAIVHTYNNGDLIACFADKISDTVVKEIAKRQPLRAVFRDSSFTSSPEKINVKEIFKLLAPETDVKVI